MQSSMDQRDVLDDAVDSGRRRAIQKIAVSVGVLAGCSMLPDKWTQPIIGQILLPAHAATSGSVLNDPCQVTLQAGTTATESVTVRVTGFVTPPAANLPTLVTATAVGGSNAQVQTQVATAEDGTFGATLTIGGGPGITSVNVVTTVTGAQGTAQCSVAIDEPVCENPVCAGSDGSVYAGNNATIEVAPSNTSHNDPLELWLNGTFIGTVPGQYTLPPTVFNGLTINSGNNTVELRLPAGAENNGRDGGKQITITSEGSFFQDTVDPLPYEALPQTWIVCGATCPGSLGAT